MIVDTHPHLVAADTRKYPIDPLGGVQSEWSKGIHLTADEFVSQMDQAGVDKATIVQASTVHGYDNSYAADSVARYPDRFVGVCCIDPRLPDAPQTLSYWIQQRGMHGVRLFTSGSTISAESEADWLGDSQLDPLWERAQELGVAVNIQTRFANLGQVRSILDRQPNLRIVLDNLAAPPIGNGPPDENAHAYFRLARYPGLYFKFSNANLRNAEKQGATAVGLMKALVDGFGAHRLMWGSNYPNTRSDSSSPYAELVDQARRALASLSEADQQWLLGETAVAVYPALRAQAHA